MLLLQHVKMKKKHTYMLYISVIPLPVLLHNTDATFCRGKGRHTPLCRRVFAMVTLFRLEIVDGRLELSAPRQTECLCLLFSPSN